MRFTVTAESDVGTYKTTNQDSVAVRHAVIPNGEVLMAIVCDGLGGLDSGELASTTVVKEFTTWFEKELPLELESPDMEVMAAEWELKLKELNQKIGEKAGVMHKSIGTTFTGALFLNDELMFVHVGDSRIYHIGNEVTQITEDQTYVNREIKAGRMTPEQAKVDKKRNVLLQCVGASKQIVPQSRILKVEKGTYLLCSDGFRHEFSGEEMLNSFSATALSSKMSMTAAVKKAIELIKRRKERDNISAILIKVEY